MTPVSDSEILKEAQSAAEEKLLSQLSTPTPNSGTISVSGRNVPINVQNNQQSSHTTTPIKKGESNVPEKEQMRESPDVDNVEKILNQLRAALKDY